MSTTTKWAAIAEYLTPTTNAHKARAAHAALFGDPSRIESGILYEGPSPAFGGRDIVVIITAMQGRPSGNKKVGPNMAHVWILVKGERPLDARKSGADSAICGQCPLKVTICYVEVGKAPTSVWDKYQRGGYEYITPEDARAILQESGRGVRLGAYGDPGVVPFETWARLLDGAGIFHTGYTHQWVESWFDARHLSYCMASLDATNTRAMLDARYPDARSYRVLFETDVSDGEVLCPSDAKVLDAKGRRKVQCDTCRLCAGTSKNAKSIAIRNEGS